MFCSNCGKEIPNEAKFCTDCGAKVAAPQCSNEEASGDLEAKPLNDARDLVSADTEAPAIGEKPAAGVNGDSSNAETVEEPVEKEGASPSNHPHAETSNDAGDAEIPCADAHTAAMAPAAGDAQAQANQMSTATGAETGSLKAAVAQNKKRSRRRIPMIVLVALALALATSVAFAAHYVYTTVWLPAHQEQASATDNPQEPATEAEAAQPEETISYSSSKTYEYVDVPSDPYRSPGQKTSQKWSYDQLTSEKMSAGAQAINNRIKTAFNATESKSSSYPSTIADLDRFMATADNDDLSCTMGRDIAISYFKNDIVGVYDSRYATNYGGSGGWPVLRGATYNVNTGESVAPQSVFGLSIEETISAAQTAVRAYLSSNPSTFSTSEACKSIATRIKSTEASGLGEDLEGSSCLVLTEKGLAYLSSYGELGDYSYGVHAIIIASDDDSLIGTEITSKEIHGIE